MKTLKSMFTNEGHFQSPRGHSYKPKYSITDWEEVLYGRLLPYGGYSHLYGVDTGIADEVWDMSNPEDMIKSLKKCIHDCSRKFPKFQDILWDMAQFIYGNCHWDVLEYSVDQQEIDEFKEDMDSYAWGVEAGKKFYAFEGPNFSTFSRYVLLLAEYGNTTK